MKLTQLLLIIFCLFSANFAFSVQEEGGDNSDYSYGEVVSVDQQDISVLEYDYEMDEEKTVSYHIKPETALINLKKAADLAKGDTVEIYFKDEGGVKVAQMIIKDDTANPVDDQTPSP